MSTTIIDHHVPDGTHDLYDVYFFNDRIQTLVTHTPALVDSWISDIDSFQSHRLIVGLDVEWRPNYSRHRDNPVATLQLCVGRRCLIFQLIHAPFIPSSLVEFLNNPMYTFVGVGIDSDARKLENDYGLWVSTTVELGPLAAQEYGISALRNAGLKELARQVLGKEIEKPRDITLSRWDNKRLFPAQVLYACIDAFISFEIRTRSNFILTSYILTFSEEDERSVQYPHNDPIVIEALIGNATVRRVMIATGSSADILAASAFDQMGIGRDRLIPFTTPFMGFAGGKIYPLGSIQLPLTLGDKKAKATHMVTFQVVDTLLAYNAILGRTSLNQFHAAVSTYHLAVKFPTTDGTGCAKGDQESARECYVKSLKEGNRAT